MPGGGCLCQPPTSPHQPALFPTFPLLCLEGQLEKKHPRRGGVPSDGSTSLSFLHHGECISWSCGGLLLCLFPIKSLCRLELVNCPLALSSLPAELPGQTRWCKGHGEHPCPKPAPSIRAVLGALPNIQSALPELSSFAFSFDFLIKDVEHHLWSLVSFSPLRKARAAE